MSKPSVELVGQVFGRLTVRYIQSTKDAQGGSVAICDCSCGKKGVPVRTRNLSSGVTKSCGCLKTELLGSDPFIFFGSGARVFRSTQKILVEKQCSACPEKFHTAEHSKRTLCDKCALKKTMGSRPSKDDW